MGRGERKRAGAWEKGDETARLVYSPARPGFLNFPVFSFFPRFLAISPLNEPLRRRETLPDIIHIDQTGFTKGRYMGENIRLISDLIRTNKK